jgi:hypothetical protein
MSRFTDKAQSLVSNLAQDERFKRAAAVTKVAAARAQDASQRAARSVAQEDSWVEVRSAVAQLAGIARAHQALVGGLVDRVHALEAHAGTDARTRPADRVLRSNGDYVLRDEGDSSPS